MTNIEKLLEVFSGLDNPTQLTRRKFLSLSTIATAIAKHAEQKDLRAEALAAKDVAWNIMMQIKQLVGAEIVDNFIAPAFYYTYHVLLVDKERYIEAIEMFKMLEDSMVKLAITKSLNDNRLAVSWPAIQSVTDAVIQTPKQPLTDITPRLLALPGGIGKGEREPKEYVWRAMVSDEGAYIYRAPDTLEPSINSLVGKGEIIMAKLVEGRDWHEASRVYNIRRESLRLSWNNILVKIGCLFTCPEVVFVPTQQITPTYPTH